MNQWVGRQSRTDLASYEVPRPRCFTAFSAPVSPLRYGITVLQSLVGTTTPTEPASPRPPPDGGSLIGEPKAAIASEKRPRDHCGFNSGGTL